MVCETGKLTSVGDVVADPRRNRNSNDSDDSGIEVDLISESPNDVTVREGANEVPISKNKTEKSSEKPRSAEESGENTNGEVRNSCGKN